LHPSKWHETKVAAILKSGKNPTLPDSYRPISLLGCDRKLIEKMLCVRFDLWAEQNSALSPTQYGFRKGKGTRDCLALLSTDINTCFEMKEQTVAAFLDISGAHDNVLIDLLCQIMIEKKWPDKVVRLLWNLLWKKELHFYVGNVKQISRTGYKGLPQGSVLSPFLYNLLGSSIDRFVPRGCNILQYADDVVIYASHRLYEIARALVQTACTSLSVFFDTIGLTISATKSEAMIFSRKHSKPQLRLLLYGQYLPQTDQFKYLGVFLDTGLRWATQIKYVQKRCLQRMNLMNSIAGTWWGAHPKCMLLLYQGLIGSVLEYASVCYANLAKTHFLKLERVQYRGIRVALGLMISTPNNSLGVLSGIPPLEERFSYLNSKFVINIFGKQNHPLQTTLQNLYNLNQHRCIKGLNLVNPFDISAPTQYFEINLPALVSKPKIDSSIREALIKVSENVYPTVAPSEVAALTAKYEKSHIIHTDGSKYDNGTGFAIHNNMELKLEIRLQSPSSVFTAEIFAIKSALDFIAEKPQGAYLILTDSLSSLMALESRKFSCKSHPIVLQCKQTYHTLKVSGHDVALAWVPAHVGILGNEIADEMAKTASLHGVISNQPPLPDDYKPISKHSMKQQWKTKWNCCDTGRFAHSIFPHITTKPWFHEFPEERKVINTISRIITGHCSVKSHLNRFKIVEDPLCVCQVTYETVDHLLWECARYDRTSLVSEILTQNIGIGTPIRDICAQKNWDALKICCSFFQSCGIKI